MILRIYYKKIGIYYIVKVNYDHATGFKNSVPVRSAF